ncbi:MAG TPA: (4Fe-4S)-binding protein [Proteobacteria bacterium]|nr:(4Fe-4S)-binding protein [Pseudomonadota bacterium]
MKELVVISGKGGAGKTSIVAGLAALAPSKVIADCDVDASDLHLVLEPEVVKEEPFFGGSRAHIRQDDCTGCGICRDYCRFDAIVERDGAFEVDEVFCEGCKVCVEFCPEGAIDFLPAENGRWYVSKTRHGTLVHARLFAAEENSGKLVTLVRKEAKKAAEHEGVDLVIADGAPGIGCPVIASLTGADMALIVTEPTPSGLHDFRRAVELVEHFKMKAACVVNKFDLNEDMVREVDRYCEQKGIPLIGMIPYDDDVTRAQLVGRSVVEHSNGPAAKAIEGIWSKLQGIL